MMKLVQTASDSSPILKSAPRASIAWALSSTTNRPCSSAILRISRIGAHWPYRCTGTIALVRLVIALRIASGSMLRVSLSQSTSTAVQPAIQIASAVAKKVLALVISSSPGPSPRAMKVSHSASVPLPTPIAYLEPAYVASCSSNFLSIGPWT